MKKFMTIILLVALVVMAAAAMAATDLTRTPGQFANQAPVQYMAPAPLTKALTVNSVTYDLTNYLMYRLITPAALTTCQVRTMTSSTKPTTGAGVQGAVFPAGQVVTSAKNVAAPFTNFSGCTGAYLQIQ